VSRPYDLLENVLIDIEKGIREGINSDSLAAQYALSERHLRRLFTFAFKQSLSDYIRSRKLTASLNDLLKTESNILDISLEYGFDYEWSYIRAFKREFGLTPGDYRKSGRIVKVKPPLRLFDENKMPDGLFFGPDIVMVPRFHAAGKLHRIPSSDSLTQAPEAAKAFWLNERSKIKSAKNGDVYIGLTRYNDNDIGFNGYLTSVQVADFKDIPQGFSKDTFEASLCAKFRYIGQHHYMEINRNAACSMYEAILKFTHTEHSNYRLLNDKVFFERIDTSLYDGTYCQMEWYAPVEEKNEKCPKMCIN
jgi:AraC family transcriptional regulator